jgi:hypothetical protein
MKKSVEDGLNEEGVLPGGLRLRRKAMSYYTKARSYKPSLKGRCLVQAYALAVSEQNASGGKIVTAPTCGSCGVVPAVLYHLNTDRIEEVKIRKEIKEYIEMLLTGTVYSSTEFVNMMLSNHSRLSDYPRDTATCALRLRFARCHKLIRELRKNCEFLYKEHPTLIFDDAFANMDGERLENTLDFLVKLSEDFQIVILSCHDTEKEYLEGKAKIINFEER